MLKMTIDNEEVLSDNDISIKEEILSPSSTILNNVYPKSWELDKDYISRFYYPKDYSKLNIQNFSIEPEEAGTTIQINGSATLTDVDTSKESRVLRILGQTSQTGTPTPSSPIPINVVSGDNYIDICGKNLFDKNTSVSGKAINKNNGNEVTDSNYMITNYIPISNGTYVINSAKVGGTDNYGITYYGSGKTFISGKSWNTLGYTSSSVQNNITFTINDSSIKYIIITFRLGTNPTNPEELQIEKGSTATTYEPYLGVENLFDKNNVSWYRNNNGAFSNATDTSTNRIRTTSFEIQGGKTYTLSGIPSGITLLSVRTYTSPSASNVDVSPSGNSFTLNDNVKYIHLLFSGNNFTSDTNLLMKNANIQIEKGTKVNSFTPYGANYIELCKIGTYQDYIYKGNGSWYLHKEIGKVVLNGSESGWGTSGTNVSGENRFANSLLSSLVLKPSSSGDIAKAISNLFICTNANQNYSQTQGFCFNSSGTLYIFEPTQKSSTVAQFQTWLSTHNVVMYYVLANSTNTEITDTTLLEQLESLSS